MFMKINQCYISGRSAQKICFLIFKNRKNGGIAVYTYYSLLYLFGYNNNFQLKDGFLNPSAMRLVRSTINN